MNMINQVTNYINGDTRYDLVFTINITCMMVLASVYLSVSVSLPSTSDIKPVEIWLLFNLAYPFLVIFVNVMLQVEFGLYWRFPILFTFSIEDATIFVILELRKANSEEGDGRPEQSQAHPWRRPQNRPHQKEKILSHFCSEVNCILYQPVFLRGFQHSLLLLLFNILNL